jgi:hypothetical protein
MNVNEEIEDSEESGSSMIDPQARIAKKAKEQHEKALKAAMSRVTKSSVSSGKNKNYGQSFGRSHYASQEESEIFSFMDSILSEKMIEILEAKELPPLKGKTEVVCDKTGISPVEYAKAQGITSK